MGRPIAFSTDELLDGALHVFVQEGYEAAHVTDIAARGGVSKPTLYARVGGKHELFLSVVDREARRLVHHLLRRYARADGRSARATVAIAVDALFEYCAAERDSFVLLFSTRLGGPAFDRDTLILNQVQSGIARLIAGHLQRAQAVSPGALRIVAALCADITITAARGAVEGGDVSLAHAQRISEAAIGALLLSDTPRLWS